MSKRKGKPLQMSMFEPGLIETVAVAELYGPEPGGIFDFIGTDWTQQTIVTCWGDLRVMCDVLADYGGILDRAIEEQPEMEPYKTEMYRIHAARCRKIAAKYGEAIGYDREAALEKCRKMMDKPDDDVGEEAMALLVKRGVKVGANAEKEATEAPSAPAATRAEVTLDQIAMEEA